MSRRRAYRERVMHHIIVTVRVCHVTEPSNPLLCLQPSVIERISLYILYIPKYPYRVQQWRCENKY